METEQAVVTATKTKDKGENLILELVYSYWESGIIMINSSD